VRILLLIHFCIALLIAAPLNLTPQEKTWIQENPTIDFVGDPDWLPFEAFDKEGNYIGIVADVLKEVEKRSALTFNIVQTSSWPESLKRMKSGKAMMISQSQDSNKETGYLFTNSFYTNPIIIVMEHEDDYVSSLYDIRKKNIAIVKSQPYFQRIQEYYPNIEFQDVDSIQAGLARVARGQSDAFVHTLAQTSYTIAQLQINSLRIVGRTEFNTKLGFGINKENAMLVRILNKILKSIEPNVTQGILSNWIQQKYVQKADFTPYLLGLGGLLFLLFIGALYTFLLRGQVQARKKAETSLQELNKTLEERIEKELSVRQDQEKILEQQSRSAAMGEMMDAVAHQWKQPLNALTMYGDLLNSDFKDGLVNQAYIDDMLVGVNVQIEHMTTTLSEFRTFFRPNKEIEEINLQKSIQSVLLLLKDELIKHSIEVEIDFEKKITLNIVENEFKHVILNIINNAKDAFNENNTHERRIKISAITSDEFIELSICDNAGGIPTSVINSIFKPNVTTKAEGKGTGIGLYMSARIIEKSHGSIYAYNSGDGACFSIELNRKAHT